jgi:hypothetical protein
MMGEGSSRFARVAVTPHRGSIVPWVFHRGEEDLRDKEGVGDCHAEGGRALDDLPRLRRSATRNMERAGIPRSVVMKRGGTGRRVSTEGAASSTRTCSEKGSRSCGAKKGAKSGILA